MPTYIVSMETGISEEDYVSAQKQLEKQGGTINHVFNRTGTSPGFEVTFPQDSVSALESIPRVAFVEQDGGASI